MNELTEKWISAYDFEELVEYLENMGIKPPSRWVNLIKRTSKQKQSSDITLLVKKFKDNKYDDKKEDVITIEKEESHSYAPFESNQATKPSKLIRFSARGRFRNFQVYFFEGTALPYSLLRNIKRSNEKFITSIQNRLS